MSKADDAPTLNAPESPVSSTTHTLPTSKFPYKYNKVHPQLYIEKTPSFFVEYVLTPLNVILMPVTVPLRGILILLFLSLNSLTVGLIDCGTDRSIPQTPARKKMVMLSNRIFCSLSLFFAGFYPKRISKSAPNDYKKSRALIEVSNHRGLLDSLAFGSVGTESILGNKVMTENFITKWQMSACRGLETGSNCVKQLKEREDSDLDWPSLLMFPEGTVTPRGVMVRPKLGAFLAGGYIQPVCLKYNTTYAVEWLAQPAYEMVFNILLTFCRPCEVTYLPVMQREENEDMQEFADRVAKAICDELGENFVPYTKNDIYYFLGKKGFTEDICSDEYIEDFGWMGNLEHYREMCKQAKLNWRVQHEREEFDAPGRILISEHMPLLGKQPTATSE